MQTKLNNKWVFLLVGIIIGGAAIGIIDANRPQPLFSKAFDPENECARNSGYYQIRREADQYMQLNGEHADPSVIQRYEQHLEDIMASCRPLAPAPEQEPTR